MKPQSKVTHAKLQLELRNKFDYLACYKDCYTCGEMGHISNDCSLNRRRYSPPKSKFYSPKHQKGFKDHSYIKRERGYFQRQEVKPVPYTPTLRPKRRLVCFTCHNEGHTSRQCKIGNLNSLILMKIDEFMKRKMGDQTKPVKEVWKIKENQVTSKDKDDVVNDCDNDCCYMIQTIKGKNKNKRIVDYGELSKIGGVTFRG